MLRTELLLALFLSVFTIMGVQNYTEGLEEILVGHFIYFPPKHSTVSSLIFSFILFVKQ